MSGELKSEFVSYLYVGKVLEETGVIHEIEKFICSPEAQILRVTSDAEARALVENHQISAIIIDQYLPHCSGVDFMRWLHGLSLIPVIIVITNRRSKDADTISALESGAVDVVMPDISARELAARIRICKRKRFHFDVGLILNRNDFASVNQIKKQAVYFNPESRRLYFSDASRVVLGHKEAELLTLLASRRPDHLDRETICQSIFRQAWNPHDRRIDNLISRLRKVMDADKKNTVSSVIETVRLEGYRLREFIELISTDDALRLSGSGTTGNDNN